MANGIATGDSVPAAAVFASIFALLFMANLFRLFQYRAWFCIPYVVGGASTLSQLNHRPSQHS